MAEINPGVAGGGSGGTSSSFNLTFPSTGTAIGASNGTTMLPLLVDGSGYLEVNVKAGSGSGLSVTDEATWTAGTSQFAPSGGVFNDSATALTSGQQGTQRLTTNRAAHVNLRDITGAALGVSANPLFSEITDGTNTANIVPGDTGFNGVAVASATKTYTFTTSASGAQTILANTPTEGFSSIEVVYTSVGSGLALTGQFAPNSGGTYVNSSTFASGASGAGGALGVSSGTIYYSPIHGNYFQIAVSALTSGTFTGTVTLRAGPIVPTASYSVQTGTWTVGSNSATGSAVPANAFYMGIIGGSSVLSGLQAAGLTGDTNSLGATIPAPSYTYNGSSWDRSRSANAAAGTTGTGLLGAGILGFDGTDWQYAGIDANHNLKVNVESQTPPVAGTIYNGQSTATTSAAALASSQALTQGVTIEALSTNTVSVFIGATGVTTSTGLELQPGASITIPANNLALVFIRCASSSPVVTYLGV